MKRLISSFIVVAILCFACMGAEFARPWSNSVYRVYNSQTGEHLYTTDPNEVTTLVDNNWKDEKTAWVAPSDGESVIRLYNPISHHHLYTKDENEISVLTSTEGWELDNGGNALFYSGGEIPIYRLYSPSSGEHHLTTDEFEYNTLGDSGAWQKEGIAFNASEAGSDESGYGIDPYADLPEHETVTIVVLNGKVSEGSEPIDYFDVYFTPTNSGTENYLGSVINTDLVGTNYKGAQIGSFELGTYTLRYEDPASHAVYSGQATVTQADVDNCEKIDRPSGQLQLIYKEISLSR